MRTVILNGNNVVSGTNNSTYKFTFPGGNVKFEDDQVAVSTIQIYYSWRSITAAQQNNLFQYVWPLPSPTTITVTIPDGFYSIDTLNEYLQTVMVANGHYLVDSSQNSIYFLELVTNETYYAVSLNAYAIPTSSQASTDGYTAPSGWPGYPTSAETPQFKILSNTFTNIVGLSAGTYPSTPQAYNFSQLSTFTPQVSPVQSVLVGVSLVDNPLMVPSNILYSFSPAGVGYGSLISSQPYALSWLNTRNGYYADFSLTLYDQNFNLLQVKDTNLVIMLLIRGKDER